MSDYRAFHFVEGSSPTGKTHVLAFDADTRRWVVPCETVDRPYSPPRFRKPLCKICGRLTSQLLYPVRHR